MSQKPTPLRRKHSHCPSALAVLPHAYNKMTRCQVCMEHNVFCGTPTIDTCVCWLGMVDYLICRSKTHIFAGYAASSSDFPAACEEPPIAFQGPGVGPGVKSVSTTRTLSNCWWGMHQPETTPKNKTHTPSVAQVP